jgi:hypothetical protein
MNDLRMSHDSLRKTDCKGRNFIWHKQNCTQINSQIQMRKK